MIPPSLKDKKRLLALGCGLLVLFSLLVYQYFKLQIIESPKWSKEAAKQHFFIVKDPFSRGIFYGNPLVKKGYEGAPPKLVMEIEKFHLFIDPEAIPEARKEAMINEISLRLQAEGSEKRFIAQQFAKKSRSRRVAMWLERETKESIESFWKPFAKKYKIPRNAIFFVSDYQRSYPYGKMLGPVLHTVQSTRDEKTGDAYPTGGLELAFDGILKGKKGKRRLMRSPRNALENGEVLCCPQDGADVYLTINPVLQTIVEEELERGVAKSHAKGAWAVMMDPHNGEILALAQYPFFHPGDYQEYFNDPKLIDQTKVKSVTDTYECGSVMKPITVAIALKANQVLAERGEKLLIDPAEKMATSNGKFPGRSKPISDTTLHRYLNMDLAIMKSSNIYCARLVERIIQRLGADWYRNELHSVFGFGVKTGIELPSESNGVLPTPGKKHPNGTLEWSVPTPFSIAFGHNIQVTALQLARAHAILVNGGKKVDPTLLKKIERKNRDGTVQLIMEKSSSPSQVLDPTIAAKVAKMMRLTTKPGGSCSRGDIWGYTEGGKSGTAEKIVNGTYSKKHYIASFVGHAPANNPAFLLVVSVDEPVVGYIAGIGKNHHGGATGSPIFREIGRRSLEYMGIAPDDPFGYPPGDPRYVAEKADSVIEAKRLIELYKSWNGG